MLEWLLRQYPDTPKTRAKQWILAGRVSVGGLTLRRPQQSIPDPGPNLALLGRRAITLDCGSGWQIDPRLTLLFLDSSLAVVNKAAGLISVPAPNCDLSALGILADFLSGDLKGRGHQFREKLPSPYRKLQPMPVHRLDQYTTGIFCMAMNASARQHLIEQLRSHTMKREYIAFVEGRPPTSRGTWRQWLELSEDELRQHVVPEGGHRGSSTAREAITHFEVVTEFPLAGATAVVTKLRLRLETGRKHQIRIHAAAAGLPLLGDRTYNPRFRDLPNRRAVPHFSRQALHAELLSLEHPEHSGKIMTWKADLPKDLRQLEASLRSGNFKL